MHTCPDCRRANPPEAAFCHFDGTSLRSATEPHTPTQVFDDRPVLDLRPRRVWLREFRLTDTPRETLLVTNRGRGRLLGHLRVTQGGDWLSLGGSDLVPIDTDRRQSVELSVEPHRLPGPGEHLAKLELRTNGGTFEIPVQADLIAVPIPDDDPHWAGVRTVRELAKRMCARPRKAAALLEAKLIDRWFATNGWAMPSPEHAAPGVAGVQQFLEELGLSRIPQVAFIADDNAPYLESGPAAGVAYECRPDDEPIRGAVSVGTDLRKWVYAFPESDSAWLIVPEEPVAGPNRATVSFAIDPGFLRPGTAEGHIRLIANGGQGLTLTVRVEVLRGGGPFTRRLARRLGFDDD